MLIYLNLLWRVILISVWGEKKKGKKGKQLLGLYYRSILIAIANVLIGYDQIFSLSSSVKKFQRKYLLNDDVL